MSEDKRPFYFNLNKDGDEAIVRLLHSKPETIEKLSIHRIEVDGKKKRILCNGDGCPLCTNGKPEQRIYIHLFDYTDNQEKVWDRTDKIMQAIEDLYKSWEPLSDAVVKITRVGNEFPRYVLEAQNPAKYAEVDKELIDKQVARRFRIKRTNEEITEFLNTGKFPERENTYIPKDEYIKQKQAKEAEQNVQQNTTQQTQPLPQQQAVFDPFADSIVIRPKRV